MRCRPLCLLLAGALTTALLGSLPAAADSSPTTLAVEGTLEVVAIDSFGPNPSAEHVYTVVTDDGAEIPVALDEHAPANGRFRGELVVEGELAAVLDDQDLLPRAGSTIGEDTRAGRAAVAEAEQQETPLTVASSTVAPVTAAAVTTPAKHNAYVAVLTNQGTVEETDAQVTALVNQMTGYWVTESSGAITSFPVVGSVKRFASSTAGTTEESCGLREPETVWNEAAALFPGVRFTQNSRNHLFVAMADECGDAGTAGVANVGLDFSSGGPMSFTMGEIATQVGIHEIGHTFGLGHANLAACTGSCEYYDLYSPMALAVSGGTFTSPALGTLYRARLGVAAAGEVTQAALPTGQPRQESSYALSPRSSTSGTRGLVVTDPSDGVRYSIDWRSGTMRDSGSFYALGRSLGSSRPTYPTGVVIEREDPDGEIALMTRPSGTRATGSYTTGTTFSPTPRLAVTVNSIGSATANVTVRLGLAEFQAPAPTISGSAAIGQTLTAVPGTWTPTPTFSYEWTVGTSTTVRGTGQTFVVPQDALGQPVKLAVTGSKADYATKTVSVPTADVSNQTPRVIQSGTPTISGTSAVGQTVTVEPGTWEDGAALTYQWLLDGTPTGGTAATYSIPASAVSRSLSVAVMGTKTGTASASRTSAAVVVAPGTFAAGSVSSSGAAVVDSVVTASAAGWPGDAAVSYQWQGNGAPIAGATSPTLAVPASLVGAQLRVVATGTRPGYAPAVASSAPVAVAAARFVSRTPKIRGTARVGKTLKVTVGSWSPRPSYRYQWYANGRKITAKGTKTSFRLTSKQKGKRITVKVTGRKAGYTTVVKASRSTKKVARRR